MTKTVSRFTPYTVSLLRLVAGFTFSLHGFQKLFGLFGGLDGHGAHPHLLSLLGAAAIIESLGGILLITGLFTRPVAFVLSGEMAVAYFLQHFPQGPLPIGNGGELAVLYCFIFLLLSAIGGGPFSLDRLRGKA